MLRYLDEASPFPPITSLQLLQFQELTNSFAQQPCVKLLIINDFRTLSVAIGVVPSSPREATQNFLSPSESALMGNTGGRGTGEDRGTKNTVSYHERC